MKITYLLAGALAVVVCSLNANATPIDREELAAEIFEKERWDSPQQREDDGNGGWKTWNSVKNAFQPVKDWFQYELPQQTPKKIFNDISDKVNDAYDYVKDSEAAHVARKIWSPIGNWITDTANKLKGKTFNEIYSDVNTSLTDADDAVSGWIEQRT